MFVEEMGGADFGNGLGVAWGWVARVVWEWIAKILGKILGEF